jgi:hypothetical protein
MTEQNKMKIKYYLLCLENCYLSIRNIFSAIFYWYLINIRGLLNSLKFQIRLYFLYKKYNFRTDNKLFYYKYIPLNKLY